MKFGSALEEQFEAIERAMRMPADRGKPQLMRTVELALNEIVRHVRDPGSVAEQVLALSFIAAGDRQQAGEPAEIGMGIAACNDLRAAVASADPSTYADALGRGWK